METRSSSFPSLSPETHLDLNNLKAIRLLGKGATGTVFLVYDSVSDFSASSPFALKLVQKSSDSSLRRARWEIQILRRLSYSTNRNPFLPKLLASSESSEFISWALPYCSGGDLNVLRHRQNDGVFSSSVIKFYLAEIVCALDHLHSMGIAYRDLKPENILLQESGHVTLTDFDLSCSLNKSTRPEFYQSDLEHDPEHESDKKSLSFFRQKKKTKSTRVNPNTKPTRPGFYQSDPGTDPKPDPEPELTDKRSLRFFNQKKKKPKSARVNPITRRRLSFSAGERSNSFVGTDEYISPEVIRGDGHDFAVDWWALGVLTYEMMYGKTPFKGRTKKETFRNVLMKEPEFAGKPSALTDLISRLLVKDPMKRLGFRRGVEEIKEHAFFRGVRWELLTEVLRPPFIPLKDDGELTEKVTENGFGIKEYFEKLRTPLPLPLPLPLPHECSENNTFIDF